MEQWENLGFSFIQKSWTELAFGIGQQIRYSFNKEEINGVFMGLNSDGAAVLKLEDGQLFTVYSGEIHFPKDLGNDHAACN